MSYFAAFGGGLVSFLSPCVLPLVPAYLSIITGLDVTKTEDRSRHQMVGVARDTGLFILGFRGRTLSFATFTREVAMAEMRSTVVGDITMRWMEEGQGPAVVFVHGIPTGPDLWRHVLPRVEG